MSKQLRTRVFIAFTLSVAIAATTVIFSFVNALVLEPLPMAEPDRVVLVFGTSESRGVSREPIPLSDFLDWRRTASSFEELAASVGLATSTLETPDGPLPIENRRVTANFARAWGLEAALGRTLQPGDDSSSAPPVVVLSHGVWARRFGSEPRILGSDLVLDGIPHTVVGVMPEALEIGDLALTEIWTPLVVEDAASSSKLQVTALLGTGVTASEADAELRALVRRTERSRDTASDGSVRVLPFAKAMAVPETWLVLGLAGFAVGLVVLVACANVASLLLARASDRRRETAVKVALGASRVQIVKPILLEAAALALLAGGAGLLLARAGLVVVRALTAHPFFQHQVTLDVRVLAFALTLAMLTPMLFALGPALHASGLAAGDVLRAGARGLAANRRTRVLREGLVVVQVAFALALLVVCFATVSATSRRERAELGFETEGTLLLRVDLPPSRYKEPWQIRPFHDELLTRLARLPGVIHAAATSRLPIVSPRPMVSIDIEGRTDIERPWAVPAAVSPAYFAAMGIEILEGRSFSSRETGGVVVLSEEAARRYWEASERAIAARVRFEDRWLAVVGVASNVRASAEDDRFQPEIYLPLAHYPVRRVTFLVPGEDESATAGAVREVLRSVDPDLAASELLPFRRALDEFLASDRLMAVFFAAFALVALTLAASGLYAVMEYSVIQRIGELALRMVLGARPIDIVARVVRRGVGLATAGVALGLTLAYPMAQLLRSAVPGVETTSWSVYAGLAVVLALVAVTASVLPALRAIKLELATALKTE